MRCVHDVLDEHTAPAHADAEVIAIFIDSKLNAGVLRRLPALRLIVMRSVGFDHIDLSYCRDRGITVCNIPDHGDYAVAEHAFALLTGVETVRRGDAVDRLALRGFELGGTLGRRRTGRIGRRAIEIGRG